MVSLVIVAHSATLAQGVKELVDQVVQGKVPIAVAGGVDDPENPLGTDAMKVLEAIEKVYSEDGVVLLMDLGSALLSAEMALDFLPEEKRARVFLSDAPLVEGAVAAAVQAAGGGTVEEVLAEARSALASKVAQLQLAPTTSPPTEETPPAQPTGQEVRLVVQNRLGLHARPAARFVTTASRFQSRITVRNVTRGTGPVNAKSINQVATLGVRQGHEIAITAEGPDAAEALAALKALVESNFGEEEVILAPEAEARPVPITAATGELVGIPASPGIAIGPAHLYIPTTAEVPQHTVDDPEGEWAVLEEAMAVAEEEIHQVRARAAAQVGEYEAAIFDAHALFLEDPALRDRARTYIFEEKLNAAAAWQRAVAEMAESYRRLDDPYMQARAADVMDVGRRVLRLLLGETAHPPAPERPSILVAEDLTPSDTAQLDKDMVLGICTALGGATSHSAILARALGIPAVVGVGPRILQVQEGEELALDGTSGRVWVRPPAEVKARLEAERREWVQVQAHMREAAQRPGATRDGHRVHVLANIIGVADARTALDYGAEGVGLMRTEFLFLDRSQPPSEAEQCQVYREVAEVMGSRPLIIRTVDVGGDKPIPYLQVEEEANPFLGWRGIRLCLDRPDLLRTQMRAILRASPGHDVRIMLPMVSTLEEVKAAREIFEEVRAALEREGLPLAERVPLGIMVEVPAAAVLADVLAPHVDFFSIGTNDLSQYTMAADRTNARVAPLADGMHPAVLRLIRDAVTAAHEVGIPVGVCGEMAGDPVAALVLVGLGVDDLSMNAPAIPRVKAALGEVTLPELQALAREALAMPDAAAVRRAVRERFFPHS